MGEFEFSCSAEYNGYFKIGVFRLRCCFAFLFCADEESFLSLWYSPNLTVASYSVGVATHVVTATAEGGGGSSGEGKRAQEEVELGSAVVGCLLLLKDSEETAEEETVFKVRTLGADKKPYTSGTQPTGLNRKVQMLKF